MANFCVSRTNQIICSVTTAEEKKKALNFNINTKLI